MAVLLYSRAFVLLFRSPLSNLVLLNVLNHILPDSSIISSLPLISLYLSSRLLSGLNHVALAY